MAYLASLQGFAPERHMPIYSVAMPAGRVFRWSGKCGVRVSIYMCGIVFDYSGHPAQLAGRCAVCTHVIGIYVFGEGEPKKHRPRGRVSVVSSCYIPYPLTILSRLHHMRSVCCEQSTPDNNHPYVEYGRTRPVWFDFRFSLA